jgi:hypothetical protein
MKNYKLLFLFLVFFSKNSFALSLQEYLSQVENDNAGYNSAKISASSSELLSKKSLLLTTPNLFANVKSGFEKQNQAIAFVRYEKLNTQNYSIGIEKDFSFGLNSKFYYNIDRSAYQGLTSNQFLPISYQTNPVLEFTMPLWKDRFGSTIRSKKAAIYHQNQANKFSSKFEMKNFQVDAEKSYWWLVSSRQIVQISTDALKQAEKILANASKKSRMNLGEKADVLQAKADVESKKLQLKQAVNDARIAARNFNQKRYLESDEVDEDLEKIDFNVLEKMPINVAGSIARDDVKASLENLKTNVANAKIEEENNKPKFDIYGSYGLQGLETTRMEAINSSFAQNGDNAYIGVKFSIPLAIGLQSDIQRGAKLSSISAKMKYRQKFFTANNDRQNLLQNLQDYQENLRLLRQIENLQKEKLLNERDLLKQGRTSTYQILLFEQDYNRSRIDTIKTAYQLLSLVADEKLYAESN